MVADIGHYYTSLQLAQPHTINLSICTTIELMTFNSDSLPMDAQPSQETQTSTIPGREHPHN